MRLTTKQSILCITHRADVEEHGLVLPLLAQVCIGTLLWLASLVGVIKVRECVLPTLTGT